MILAPERRAFTLEPFSGTGEADVLAWKSSVENVNCRESVSDGADVGVAGDARVMPGKHSSAERVPLDLENNLTSCRGLDREIQPTDAREQGADA